MELSKAHWVTVQEHWLVLTHLLLLELRVRPGLCHGLTASEFLLLSAAPLQVYRGLALEVFFFYFAGISIAVLHFLKV